MLRQNFSPKVFPVERNNNIVDRFIVQAKRNDQWIVRDHYNNCKKVGSITKFYGNFLTYYLLRDSNNKMRDSFTSLRDAIDRCIKIASQKFFQWKEITL